MTLTLIMSVVSFKVSDRLIQLRGDNFFRQYFYGVGQHNYILRTWIGGSQQFPAVTLNTSSTGICGVWDGFIKLNTTSATFPNNELKIRPTSPNDAADYLDGVSTGDLVLLQRHILGIQPFTTGYQYISADVNEDNNVTAADLTMLRALILGTRNNLTRNSWEWFEYSNVNQSPTGFSQSIPIYSKSYISRRKWIWRMVQGKSIQKLYSGQFA
ncbi:MAG: hypothetical protein IPJ13_06610 [Saprospiraceae bacterium]|nr:hypothetical protein [Saprospiraceae bacterium]